MIAADFMHWVGVYVEIPQCLEQQKYSSTVCLVLVRGVVDSGFGYHMSKMSREDS